MQGPDARHVLHCFLHLQCTLESECSAVLAASICDTVAGTLGVLMCAVCCCDSADIAVISVHYFLPMDRRYLLDVNFTNVTPCVN
jgi:hypothetical protein